jgi:hypothetical protein
MIPHSAIFVRGGAVQGVASDTADVLISVLDMDSILTEPTRTRHNDQQRTASIHS